MTPRKFVVRNLQSPGDVLMLTAAVRDLKIAQGSAVAVDVRTSVPQLWENSPYLDKLSEVAPGVEIIDCEYPTIDFSNRLPLHFVGAFHSFLSERLNETLKLTEFKGDVHLSERERTEPPPFSEGSFKTPYWIVSAGGKRDFTIKWWDTRRFQEVVNYFTGRLTFVQVGAAGHYHPKLDGAIDLRGRTSIRELIRLVHHSAGVLTPVSFLMHLAAAVEPSATLQETGLESRPCVVIAGGREPPHWEAYPNHQFIHTVGALDCCRTGGCWRSRTRPLGDGSDNDSPRRLCLDVVNNLPRCMDMITAPDVIRRIEMYLDKPRLSSISRGIQVAGDSRSTTIHRQSKNLSSLTNETVGQALDDASHALSGYPEGRFSGRGVVICAGGDDYTPCAWVCIQMLRHTGCKLPVEIWHFGDVEFPIETQSFFKPLGVEFIDATRMRRRFPARRLGGWELKAYALVHSRFEEMLLLDADNVPIENPELLFETRPFKRYGAIFWPDIGRMSKDDPIWKICGIPPRVEMEFESGQAILAKRKCWKALSLALWFNEHSDFFYKHIHGDKETFHLAFRKLEQPYAMPKQEVRVLKATMCQHDFKGRVIFQHRNLDKWRLDGNNIDVPGFAFDVECREYLAEFRRRLAGSQGCRKEESTTVTEKNAKISIGGAEPVFPSHMVRKALQPGRRVVFRGPLNAYTGYGLHSLQIISDLQNHGCEILVRPTELAESFARIPKNIRRLIVLKEQPDEWELLLHPPNIPPTPGKRTIYFTMWEASRLPAEWVGFLNQADCIVVPCQWNATSFSASGVTRPIYIVPLGVKTNVFKWTPPTKRGPCVFGAGGKIRGGGERKSLNEVISIFQEAFPSENDVRLKIKAFPDCGVHETSDPRIEITAAYISEREMASWYASLTCFVSLSRSEGWGLMPHQAMAVGRPCIATAFGGQAEFINACVGYPARFRLVPASYNYAGGGVWAEPERSHITELMRHVYAEKGEARERGHLASRFMRSFSWKASNAKLCSILRERNAIE